MKAAPGNRREDDRVQPTHVAFKLEVNENKQRHGQWETQKIDKQDKADDPAKNINDAAARDLGWHVIRKIKIHGGAFDCIAAAEKHQTKLNRAEKEQRDAHRQRKQRGFK